MYVGSGVCAIVGKLVVGNRVTGARVNPPGVGLWVTTRMGVKVAPTTVGLNVEGAIVVGFAVGKGVGPAVGVAVGT
jgi:hypothetical protein